MIKGGGHWYALLFVFSFFFVYFFFFCIHLFHFFCVLVWPCQLFVRLWYRVSNVLDLSKKSERGDSGMGQHGQRLNTGTCFSVSSDDKLVLFLFPGIPTGDPAIVAFYDNSFNRNFLCMCLS
jgi:hypothetical protein